MEAPSCLCTPFGDGYRVCAQAYRAQLSHDALRAILPQAARPKLRAAAAKVEQEAASLEVTAERLCRERLWALVLWELLAVLSQGVSVVSLGLVLYELEFGAWLEHEVVRAVLLAVLMLIARFAQQLAKHRKVKITEQVTCTLRSYLFRRAAQTPFAPELQLRLPMARLQLLAPCLGLALAEGCQLAAVGPLALALLPLQLSFLGLEAMLLRGAPRWMKEAVRLREQREAMSAAVLTEMGCTATVKWLAWEQAVLQRLQSLRHLERGALRRQGRLEALASVMRELAVVMPWGLGLLLYWMIHDLGLWSCFLALAACRMSVQELRQIQKVLKARTPQAVEEPPQREVIAPKQGDRNTYKSSRYAVSIDGMRFFWEDAPPPKSARGGAALQEVMKRAEAKGNALHLVESISDDASVAERARRSSSGRFDLKVLSLQVKRGAHVALVGATGSGKSTLLAGLTGGCHTEHWGEDSDGGVLLSGRLAYVPQHPVILASCSIRENVLFGRAWDPQRYEQAASTSSLSEELVSGDCLVEELSGEGLLAMQLARALYAEAQILLLDDPFQDMDCERAKRILSSLAKKFKDRTIILATQKLSVLSAMDSIIVLRNGTVFEQGDFKTLSSMPTEFSRLLLISTEKEVRRARQRDGVPCPFLCYEVGPDPLRELYPLDEEFGTFPSFGSKGPKRWVSVEPEVRAVVKAAPLAMDVFRELEGEVTALLRAPSPRVSEGAAGHAGDAEATQEVAAEVTQDRPTEAQEPTVPKGTVGVPSASAVPMVGASEAGGFGQAAQAASHEAPKSPTSPQVPLDESIPRLKNSQMAVSDKLPPMAEWVPDDSAPGSPESGDGLRRRLAHDVEVDATPVPFRADALHGAPPQLVGKPRDEERLKRRRSDREEPRDLEKAIQEKNKKIADLEKQVAKAEKKELLRSASSSSILEGRFGGPSMVARKRGRGFSVLLLLRAGSSAWFLVLAALLDAAAQLAVPVLLSYAFVPSWRLSTTGAPSIPGPSVATSRPSTWTAPPGPAPAPAAPAAPAPSGPTFPPDVVVDDSEVVWRGFDTTSDDATSSSTSSTGAATTEAQALEDWRVKFPGHFCHEPNLAQETKPQGLYDLDPTVGWHWANQLSLTACKRSCEELISWGCRFISWGGPVSAKRWCYVHQQCPQTMKVSIYQVLEMDLGRRLRPSRGGASRRLEESQAAWVPPARQLQEASSNWHDWLLGHPLKASLAGLGIVVPLLAIVQARLAARLGLQASEEAFSKLLRAVLAAPGELRDTGGLFAEGSLFPEAAQPVKRKGFLKDLADAEEFLPMSLVRALAASSQVLASIVSSAAASGRQAVPAVTLTLALGLSVYLYRMRLPLLHQIRCFQEATADAAALRLKHLAECREVLRVHGRLATLCDDYEALCADRAMAATAVDAAERWLYTRLHCLVSVLLGLLCFSLFTQAPSAIPSELGLAVSIAALVQVALLPDALVELMKYGGRLTHGLEALRRMSHLLKETEAEELQSPIFKLKVGSERRGPERLKRSGKVALGEVMIDQEMEIMGTRHQEEQSFSVAGFPVEKVPGDWPYFGAIAMEDITVRHSVDLLPALSECSLSLDAGKALLLVGSGACGKSTLLKALLRLVDLEAGRILLDGVDVRSVGLSTLRGRMAIVPQEVVLFHGTWRQNLDPMDEFSEEELQMVLRLSRFENWMHRYAPKGLDQLVNQASPLGSAAVLLGVSRALLRLLQKRSKLLLLDAITCRLSPSSDADLTALLLRYCRRCAAALLQTSRRVQQAPLYDEVAVMSMGRVLEQGPAKKLWVKDGPLRRMAKEQGLDSAKMTKGDVQWARLGSVYGWEVSPQEHAAWHEEFAVAMKKVKSEKKDAG